MVSDRLIRGEPQPAGVLDFRSQRLALPLWIGTLPALRNTGGQRHPATDGDDHTVVELATLAARPWSCSRVVEEGQSAGPDQCEQPTSRRLDRAGR